MDSNTATISIVSPYVISGINYIAGSLMVTAGQQADKSPKFQQKSSTEWEMSLNADRENSTPVAQSFNSIVGGGSHEYADGWRVDSSPDQLNFYFGVNLSVQIVGSTQTIVVYFGQGNSGTKRNNWWFGSNALNFVVDPRSTSPIPNMLPQVAIGGTPFNLGAGISSFDLQNWPKRP
ncbi:hypothetical protein [Paraburkholderia sediminicola]|uniref:hypothetical protein n=1 Tax=Paraburkholderia sediminicola TaxID=458836 RepID=UPI0038B9871C